MEKRAIRVSFEFWKQIMTHGYTSGGIQCVNGLPEDARLCLVTIHHLGREPDPIFVFESASWKEKAKSYAVTIAGVDYPLFDPTFQVAECRTCKWWSREKTDISGVGICGNHFDNQVFLDGSMLTVREFGCVQYEKRLDA